MSSWAVLNDCSVDRRGSWCRFIILHERNGSALPQSCSLQHFWAINIPSQSFCHLLTSGQLTNQFCYVRKCVYLNQSVLFCLHVCNCNSQVHKEVTQNHFSYFSQNYLRYLLGVFKTSFFFHQCLSFIRSAHAGCSWWITLGTHWLRCVSVGVDVTELLWRSTPPRLLRMRLCRVVDASLPLPALSQFTGHWNVGFVLHCKFISGLLWQKTWIRLQCLKTWVLTD